MTKEEAIRATNMSKEEVKIMKTFDNCNWAVCYDIPGDTQDDGQAGRTICAWFSRPFQAEEFIEKVLPAANRERFYIIHRDNM